MKSDLPPASESGQFQSKWSTLRPELALALRFVDPAHRPLQAALQCLLLEIEYAAYRIREDSVAVAKLSWWADELGATVDGRASHPLTAVLASDPRARAALAHGSAVIAAAMAQRDRDPASTLDALMAQYHPFTYGLSTIESQFLAADPEAGTKVRTLDRALRDLAALPALIVQGELPLPLDILARHGLTRDDLERDSAARNAAASDMLRQVSQHLRTVDAAVLSPSMVGVLHAHLGRARRATRSREPLAALDNQLMRLTPAVAWQCWRHARRRPSG